MLLWTHKETGEEAYYQMFDYEADKWSLSYNCTVLKVPNLPPVTLVNLYLVHANPTPSDAELAAIHERIQGKGLDTKGLSRVTQDCSDAPF